MFRKIAKPPGNDTRHVLISRKRIRAQARADAIIQAAQAHAERLIHSAQTDAEHLIDDARRQAEAALSRGFAAGLTSAFDALSRYWLDSGAWIQSVHTTVAEQLCTTLRKKLGTASFVEAMIAEIRLQAHTPEERHIHIALPCGAAPAAQALRDQWNLAGIRADVVEHANPHALSIRWGPHHWAFDADTLAQELVTQALSDAIDGPLSRAVAEQQSAAALRALANRLAPAGQPSGERHDDGLLKRPCVIAGSSSAQKTSPKHANAQTESRHAHSPSYDLHDVPASHRCSPT